jgi:hypothetical protein
MANGNGRKFWLADGQWSFEGGTDSGRVPTIASQTYPEGLKRTQLAWMGNCTARSGTLTHRSSFQPVVQNAPWSGLFQGAYMYEPDGGNPYIVMGVGGKTWQARVDTDNSVHDLNTGVPATVMPANQPYWWMKQGEQFLVIQDSVSPPRVWDGVTLKTGPGAISLPIGTAMDYFMGRMWVCTGTREYVGGDIVRGPSGTPGPPYGLRDSILRMTENAYLAGGGAFVVPANDGIIRAIFHTAELDTSLGQGRLYIGTRKTIYNLNVPVFRVDWNAVDNTKIPQQVVAQIRFGPVGDRSVVPVNGDVFYQSLEPGIRSLTLATRYFQQWGNVGISRNENRVLAFNDRSLLRFSSGIEFDNRLLQTCLPFQTPVGVAHRGIIPLDFDLISSIGEKYPPAWEGMWEGLQVLQLLEGDFGGLQRAFAVVLSQASNQIEIWEIRPDLLRDNSAAQDARIDWYFETPSFTCGDLLSFLKLVAGELWLDNIVGKIHVKVEYRPDQSPCWYLWDEFDECNARDCREANIPCAYPIQPLCPANRSPRGLPEPPVKCEPSNNRPSVYGFQFQVRVTIKGTCDIKGVFIYCQSVDREPYKELTC